MLRFGFIVATRNRPRDIRALLMNIQSQSVQPNQIIVVDSSEVSQPELVQEFPDLRIEYHAFRQEPSAAAQRNAGLAHVREDLKFIGFVDDDMIFENDALQNMLDFWKRAEGNICGAAFNWVGEDTVKKREDTAIWRFAQWLGLYRLGVGQVAPSGWHGRVQEVGQDTQVEWLITGAVVWRSAILKDTRFDPFYQGYSYLEDLDFSYGVSRHCDLVIVADARVNHYHHHSEHDAQWNYAFGRMEVHNRRHFVRKYNLSAWRCYLALIIRLFMTLVEALKTGDKVQLARAKGNLTGLRENFFEREGND